MKVHDVINKVDKQSSLFEPTNHEDNSLKYFVLYKHISKSVNGDKTKYREMGNVRDEVNGEMPYRHTDEVKYVETDECLNS